MFDSHMYLNVFEKLCGTNVQSKIMPNDKCEGSIFNGLFLHEHDIFQNSKDDYPLRVHIHPSKFNFSLDFPFKLKKTKNVQI